MSTIGDKRHPLVGTHSCRSLDRQGSQALFTKRVQLEINNLKNNNLLPVHSKG